MTAEDAIFLGASRKPDDSYQQPEYLALKYGNRHGLVTGATGTGKTVTLQVLAESFSAAGVPVFSAPTSRATFPASARSAFKMTGSSSVRRRSSSTRMKCAQPL